MCRLLKASLPFVICLILLASVGLSLIAASYSIPDMEIWPQASNSTDFLIVQYQEKDVEWLDWPDFYTDMVMLNVASYGELDGKSPWVRAIENEKFGYTQEASYPYAIVNWLTSRAPVVKTYYTYDEATPVQRPCSYGKYWNGYLVYLRPLLTKLNMNQIFTLFRFLLIGSFAAVTLLFAGKSPLFLLFFVPVFLSLRPFSKFCLTFAIIELLLLVFLAIAVWSKRIQQNAKAQLLFFFAMGIVSNYFTLMAFSMVIPFFCAAYLAYGVQNPPYGNHSRTKVVLFGLLSYIVGFCAMWVLKWLLLLLVDFSLIQQVLYSITVRFSHTDYGEPLSLKDTLLMNFYGYYYRNPALYVCCALALLLLIVFVALAFKGRKKSPVADGIIACVIGIGCVFGRYLAFLNHSKVHFFFMNRLYVGVPCFLLCFLLCLIKQQRQSSSLQEN